MPRRRVTRRPGSGVNIYDVARECGVAPLTVSRASHERAGQARQQWSGFVKRRRVNPQESPAGAT
jgi:hypothetical protein